MVRFGARLGKACMTRRAGEVGWPSGYAGGMALPDHLAGLLDPAAYPHACGDLRLVETHISWVILTGDLAYKLKKPVRFPFVDFSTLARREHFCREELRCNRRFAPELYLDVVPVVRDDDGRLRVDGRGQAVEWAVKMRQFPADAELDRVLERGELGADMLETFGSSLAAQHAELPAERLPPAELEPRVLKPARDNFDDLRGVSFTRPYRSLLDAVASASARQAERHRALMIRRLEQGWIRECHGDLHLSNLVLLEGAVRAFDCLEFNPTLRWIDPQSDVAFLFMDCLVRGRDDLGYAFLDGYLDGAGDYDGVRLLPFYAGYRSMVRAKVAALRREQAAESAAFEERFLTHARWAAAYLGRPPGRLVLMCGVSGSGKSYLAERLAPALPAIRLRSDVARKVQAGLPPTASARADVGAGLYDRAHSDAVYGWLADLAEDLLRSGENVIVDAAFLAAERRRPFLELAARLGRPGVVVHCQAPAQVLRERVRRRALGGGDASDADLAVLEHQLGTLEPPVGQVVPFDSSGALGPDRLARLRQALLDPGPDRSGPK